MEDLRAMKMSHFSKRHDYDTTIKGKPRLESKVEERKQ